MSWTPSLIGDAVALSVRGGQAVVALSDGSLALSSDGERWESVGLPPGAAVPTSLLALPDALLVGTWTGLYRAHPSLTQWTLPTGLPAGTVVVALAAARAPSRPLYVVAGTLRRGVFQSDDGGQTWVPANAGLPLGGAGLEVHAVAVAAHGVQAAHPFGISRSADGGRRWAAHSAGLPIRSGRVGLAAVGGSSYASAGGRVYQTRGGEAWSEVYDAAGAGRPLALLGAAARTLYAASPSGSVLWSGDEGRTWAALPDGLPSPPAAVSVVGYERVLLAALGADGVWGYPLTANGPSNDAPSVNAHLEDAAPNPFSDATWVAFSLSGPADILLTVHDVFDAEVSRVAEGPFGSGRHRVRIEAGALADGLYQCRLRVGGRTETRPLALVR